MPRAFAAALGRVQPADAAARRILLPNGLRAQRATAARWLGSMVKRPLDGARAQRLRLLRARLASLGGAALLGKPGPLGAQQPSPVLERAAFNVADPTTLIQCIGSVLLVLLDAVMVLPLLHAALRPRQRALTAAPRVDTPLVQTPKMQHAQSPREVSYNTV